MAQLNSKKARKCEGFGPMPAGFMPINVQQWGWTICMNCGMAGVYWMVREIHRKEAENGLIE